MKFNKLTGYGVVGEDRRCGRSLSLALRYLGRALGNPGSVIKIVDHHDSRGADTLLFGEVGELIDKLELKNIVRNRGANTIMFDLYTEREAPDVVLHAGKLVRRVDPPSNLIYLDGVAYKREV